MASRPRGVPVTERDLTRRFAAEGLGTAFLLAAVVGSGIMAERLSGGSVGLALLANAIATGGALVALILTFGPLSGAHFNPVVTLMLAARRTVPWRDVPPYLVAQLRTGLGQWVAEATATFGLLLVVRGCGRRADGAAPYAVAAYITAAYWFTASTSFANPAVTIARALSDTFAGITPADASGFILAQLAGMMAAMRVSAWIEASPQPSRRSSRRSGATAPPEPAREV
jgi:glycerol uptake facilitator-like aquaporin